MQHKIDATTSIRKAPSLALPLADEHQQDLPTQYNYKRFLHQRFPTKGIAIACVGIAFYVLLSCFSTSSIIFFPFWRRSSHESHPAATATHSQISGRSLGFTTLATPQIPTARIRDVSVDLNASEPDLPTDLRHIVFCIASTVSEWGTRQEYVKLWWKPPPGGTERRGFVWLDEPMDSSMVNFSSMANSSTEYDTLLPDVQISSNATEFPYTWKGGNPSAVRISRIISDAFRLGLDDVRWFVMGDDDTIFFPENLAAVLRKYDHRKLYYIGQSTESQKQSVTHSFGMAYGGGGIAVSFPFAKAMEKMQDDCLYRYAHLYGSDSRIGACAAELGVPLTRELGFHQIDLHSNIFGLLAAHPIAPLVSLHHIDQIQPIFPDRDRIQALRHLINGGLSDQEGLLQQSICYDMQRHLTFSVSWGYAVQIFTGILTPLEVQKPIITFQDWRTGQAQSELFTFDVRAIPEDHCEIPSVFFIESIGLSADGTESFGVYRRKTGLKPDKCPRFIEHDIIEVYKQPQSESWITAPQRQCCEVAAQKFSFIRPQALTLEVRDCKKNEVIAPHK